MQPIFSKKSVRIYISTTLCKADPLILIHTQEKNENYTFSNTAGPADTFM